MRFPGAKLPPVTHGCPRKRTQLNPAVVMADSESYIPNSVAKTAGEPWSVDVKLGHKLCQRDFMWVLKIS